MGDDGHQGSQPAGSTDGLAATGVSPELLDRLLPHLAESIMVLDGSWNVVANLAPPGGLIGRGYGLGLHTLEDMHPDDAVQILDLGVQAFATEPGWEGSMVVRMQRGDGTYGRYEITATNRFDDPVVSGLVVRTREVPHDAGPHTPGLEDRLAVEMLAELLPTGVVVLDGSGRPVYVNSAACSVVGREPEELKREGLLAAIAEVDRERISAVVARVTAVCGSEVCTVGLEGRSGVVECRFSSVGEPEVAVVVVTVEDVTRRQAAEQALERRANHDALTGLRNRSALLDLLHERLDDGRATSVAYVDLDGFKRVNDQHGHADGDHLLVAVAHALDHGLGPDATAARIGGDEMVVVAPGGDADGLADRVRAVVASVDRARHHGVGCSVGVAVTEPGDTPRDLLHRADEQMYADKRRKRTRLGRARA